MKQFFIYSMLFIAACGNNAATEPPANSATSDNKSEMSASTSQGTDVVGEWEMVGSVMDTNDNLQVDEAERKNLQPATYKDYMKLNKDGSGLFTVAKIEGRYETTVKEGSDKKVLTWYDKSNSRHRIGTIVSVSKAEMHIKEPGGNGLFIWKRL